MSIQNSLRRSGRSAWRARHHDTVWLYILDHHCICPNHRVVPYPDIAQNPRSRAYEDVVLDNRYLPPSRFPSLTSDRYALTYQAMVADLGRGMDHHANAR